VFNKLMILNRVGNPADRFRRHRDADNSGAQDRIELSRTNWLMTHLWLLHSDESMLQQR
jgi:hypothetical protein